jgi:UDP-N-acetylglucosamine 1-carboxyvinyltransferase
VIGRRRVDTHFTAFEQMGATVSATDRFEFRAAKLRGADVFWMSRASPPENALMAAVYAEGTTVLRNAASEPHVQDLANFLVARGRASRDPGQHDDGARPATLHGATHHRARSH